MRASIRLSLAALFLGSLSLSSCASLLSVLAGSASSSQGTTQTTAPAALPPETTALLAPLFGATASYAPAGTPVADLPADLDPLSAIALHRLNFYRAAVGLPPYRYDASLTRMALAHVAYAMASSRAKLAWQGHFELPGQPGYSKEGNEAASTSGLAYGDSDPLAVLESLMAGTYHRLQFLRAGDSRVGVGYGRWEGDSSIGLFVTRGGASATRDPRFLLFPPDGSREIQTTFNGENPDPRPGFDALESTARPATGYPITISLQRDDLLKYRSAEVDVEDSSESPVPCWVTDPAHPSTNKAPPIYAKGESNDAVFQTNFGAVFIMPKAPLRRGETYRVRVTLHIGSEAIPLKWSFETAPAYVWKVAARPLQPWRSFQYAMGNASQGDTIQLEAGVYDIAGYVGLSGIRIVGAGAKETRIRVQDLRNNTPFGIRGAVAMEQLTVQSPSQAIYVMAGATLLLRNMAFAGGNGQNVAIGLERGSTLVADALDASQFRTSYLCYSLAQGTGGPPRLYWRGSGFGGIVYGEAEFHRIDQPLPLPYPSAAP